MPKLKTHKGMKKRFKVTATGKVRHRNAFRGHHANVKSPKRRRKLRLDAVMTGAFAAKIAKYLLPGE